MYQRYWIIEYFDSGHYSAKRCKVIIHRGSEEIVTGYGSTHEEAYAIAVAKLITKPQFTVSVPSDFDEDLGPRVRYGLKSLWSDNWITDVHRRRLSFSTLLQAQIYREQFNNISIVEYSLNSDGGDS